MGKHEVTIYTCDGCHAQTTLPRHETPRGFTRIRLAQEDKWLCTDCYRAVEWVVKFQGRTPPPEILQERAARRRKDEEEAP